jgi:hypothetical protein
VILGDDVTRVAISFRAPGSGRGRSRRMFLHAMAPAGGVPFGRPGGQQLTLADDRGTSAAAHFSGGGDDREWRGQLEATAPLAADTAWIELDGERIELDDAAPEVEVSVEGIPGESPAVRHLWHLVASRRHHMASSDTAQPAIDALVACGALDPADPAIDEAQAAREAIAHGPMGSGPGAPRLPDPWASLLARRTSADGPSGTVVLGAVTPPFDGIGVAVSVLESSAEGWTIEVEVAPDVVMMDRPFGPRGTGSGVTWWARDNRGNHYLGAPGQWSGHGDRGSGEIGFWPALDPQATELVLMPTGERERAVIRTALAWNAGTDVTG